MALSPVETLNVFRTDVREELKNRSKSENLLRTRTPFIRFTTATDMSNITTVLDNQYEKYQNCRYFTLGLHGWDNLNYNVADIYGIQSNEGLVVGTTYNQQTQQQSLVRVKSINMAQNYPPPGITSAKVERVRSGNVLKFTVNIQCYTQEQLELLDVVCMVPGMTCVLEWGTQMTTPNGTVTLDPILNYKNRQVDTDIRSAFTEPRRKFIDKWCSPNKFNYDWAVANIANVKTRIENDIYKITVVAYGRADNLLYISAYATSNPLDPAQIQAENVTTRSINEYFKIHGTFSTLLRDTASFQNRNTNVLKFRSEVNQEELQNVVPQETSTNTTNDIGYEDAYFVKFDYFIRDIINGPIRGIINGAMSAGNVISQLIVPLAKSGEDQIKVGFNEFLRSTSPETVIIYNTIARGRAARRVNTSALKRGAIGQLGNAGTRINITAEGRVNSERGQQGALGAYSGQPIAVLDASPFGAGIPTAQASGITNFDGVWLNSKAIQSAFLNARTIMEGMEALLRNINAATENYWDLKLFWDDEQQAFRILDDNVRDPKFSNQDRIYEFNKKIDTSNADGVLGPDVLNIEVDTDYPKMLFSQLAVSGINGGNLISDPRRRDMDFVRNTSLKDIFARESTRVTSDTPSRVSTRSTSTMSVTELVDNIAKAFYGNNPDASITNSLSAILVPAFPGNVPPEVSNIITDIFNIKGLLTVGEAAGFRSRFETAVENGLTVEQSVAVLNLLAKRSESVIVGIKNREREVLQTACDNWPGRLTFVSTNNAAGGATVLARQTAEVVIFPKIQESQDKFIRIIRNAVQAGTTEEQRAQTERVRKEAERQQFDITTSRASR